MSHPFHVPSRFCGNRHNATCYKYCIKILSSSIPALKCIGNQKETEMTVKFRSLQVGQTAEPAALCTDALV